MQSPEPDQQLHAETHQAQSPTADLEPAVNEPIEAAVTAPDVLPVVPPTAAPSPAEPAPAEPAPVSLQTIANAYRDYTRKSFEEIGCYFEQLTSARSLDKAMKVQADFMKRAYETSVSESQSNLRAPQPACQANLPAVSEPGGKEARDAREILSSTRD